MSNNIFTENSNKAMLWDILEESFSNLNHNDYNEFKIFFDKHIHETDNHLNNENIIELIEKNKFFIKNTILLINNNQWKQKYNMVKTNELYTSNDLQENRMNEFEKRFVERQKEFSNLINLNKPDDISFEDKNEEVPLYDMQSKLKQIELEREEMINNTNYITDNNESKKIKIIDEDKKKLTFENLIETSDVKKKVTFNHLVDTININNEVETIHKNNINDEIDNIKQEIKSIKDLIQEVNLNILKVMNNNKDIE